MRRERGRGGGGVEEAASSEGREGRLAPTFPSRKAWEAMAHPHAGPGASASRITRASRLYLCFPLALGSLRMGDGNFKAGLEVWILFAVEEVRLPPL